MKTIKATDLKKHLEKGDVVLIDVREKMEHQSACIDGSCLMPMDQVSIKHLPKADVPIVFYCRSGKRSLAVCQQLLAHDPSLDVCSLDGGILAWQQAGFPLKCTSKKRLPIDQQTQIVTGFLCFSGVMLGTFWDSRFYIFPGFIGCGLIFAGITGWCGMAKLIAKMPWNR